MLAVIAHANQGTAQWVCLLAAVIFGGAAVAAWVLKNPVLAVIAAGLAVLAVALLFHA
jgi:hypothetical protein